MRSILDIQLAETPQLAPEEEINQLYIAVKLLAEHVAFLRYGIFTTTNPFAQNTPIVSNPIEKIKCDIGITQNTLLHITATPSGLFATIADSSQGKFANGIAKSNEVGGSIDVQLGSGILTGYSGLIPGKYYYLSVSGTFTALPNTAHPIIQKVGIAISATSLEWIFFPPAFN